jgi:PAS domain S-box-containing protein
MGQQVVYSAIALVIFIAILVLGLVWWIVRSLNHLQRDRLHLEQCRIAELEQINQKLQQELIAHQQTNEALQTSQAHCKQLELSLQNAENRLHDIMHSPIAAIAQIRVFANQDWEIDFISAGCEAVFGYTAQEFLDNKFLWIEHIEPEDLKTVILPLFQEVFAERIGTYEYRFRHKDGTRRWLSGKFASRYNATAGCWDVNQLAVDISDLKQAELALRQSEARFHAFMDNCPASAWITDLDGQVLYLSQTYFRSFQLPTKDAIGKTLFELFPVEVAQQFFENIQTVSNTRQVLEAIELAPRRDGTLGEFLVYKFPVSDSFGRLLVGGFAVDVTERSQAEKARKRSEELLRASLKEKEVLLKEIHHRVKNNLQIVDSLLHMQSRRAKDEQISSILQDSCNRIQSIALVHEKLYGSQNLADIHFSSYILDLTAHLFDSYTIGADSVNLDLRVDTVYMDIEMAIPCGLIINELVSNALKYAFPDNRKGVIQVEFYSNPDRSLTLCIRDNGIGIPLDLTLEQSPSLGFTLVKNLVEQLEGTLELKRTPGTEFRITLPEN